MTTTLAILGRVERMEVVLRQEQIAIAFSLKQRREAIENLSQRKLARLAGVNEGLYRRMEKFGEWSPKNVRRVDATLSQIEQRGCR